MGEEVPEQAPPLGRTRFFLEALVGSGFFTGYFPIAPATVTSLFVLLPAFFLARLPGWNALAVVAVFFTGVPIATDLEKVWGEDPGRVTIDEVAGTLVTFFLNPVSIWGLGVGFLLSRFFDIFKLPFIDKSQRLPGGWGIMVDDVLAGICANLVLRFGLFLLPVLRYHS
ncbi:MAG: phosphatidylglycerophosphatase A [candidate division WOR-3 bacterium]|nr:phosphatidylglycerophosphatase A [candidate division WOR-3 bacterium]